MKLLLEKGTVDIESRDPCGWTPLSLAAGNGCDAVVRLLLNTREIDIESRDHSGRTPPSWAVGHGYETVPQLLLETRRVNVDSRDLSGRTPLSWAAARGNQKVVQLLLETGKADIESKDQSGRTPLSWAAGNGCEKVVQLLLEIGQVNIQSLDQYGQSPLSRAACSGNTMVVKLLFNAWKKSSAPEAGPRGIAQLKELGLNTKNELGETPLCSATMRGSTHVVRFLLSTGIVDTQIPSRDGEIPLLIAQRNDHSQIAEMLLQAQTASVGSSSESHVGTIMSRKPFEFSFEGDPYADSIFEFEE